MEIIVSSKNSHPLAPIPSELRKHVAAIHTSGQLSFLERKMFNVFLANAFDTLLSQRRHVIPVNILADMIGFNSKNVGDLKDALTGIMKKVLEYDLLAETGDWEAAPLLAYAAIKSGQCHYEFSSFLAEKLADPEIYTTINLHLQRKVSGAYALALYENCVRFRSVGSTGWISVQKWRMLLGADASTYDEFKHFNDQVIKKSIIDVNKNMDIQLTAEYRRENRRVVEIKFLIEEKGGGARGGVSNDAELERIKSTEAFRKLTALGVGQSLAATWIQQDPERALAAANYTDKKVSQKLIKSSPAGYVRKVFLGDAEIPLPQENASPAAAGHAASSSGDEERLNEVRAKLAALSDAERASYVVEYAREGGAVTSYNPDTGKFRILAERTGFTAWLSKKFSQR
ncbi:TPA: replication initiation protein [Burkholderia cepacia]|jgi:hypothetical protein|nr:MULTISPECIES: replication initiation protein [Burkholderia]KKL36455.1 hypothetical protein WR31_25000 [Burkholderia contaminans LMG 23361]MBA9831038.1 RepB family plasmid replication initiator protein [Burkholderia contaminans]MBA9839098.1 RepB family plasmid replication initiator protein [Burkholderia contaminans]MBA9864408.1 RepB family plasmid replication initiator protein [Burkholderia contaminans]MBA9906678.1 RepB family plasmid replication initiator protein [Burkholderia contaminans]